MSYFSIMNFLFIKKSGLVVSASQFSPDQKAEFNPNINISSRNIEIAPAPNRSHLIAYAKQILLSLVPKGNNLAVDEISFNNSIGVQSSYQYQLPGNKILNVLALATIIIDEQANNYFIIVASCPEENSKIYEDLFRDTVKSFKLLKEIRDEG